MKQVQEPTLRKTLIVATSRIRWQLLIGLVAAIAVMSIVVLSGQELKHVPPAAPSFMVLDSFTAADGAQPLAGLIRDAAGNLYGTTAGGGAHGLGVVFKLGPSGTETVLHSFAGFPTDGGGPNAGLTRDAAGNLYGTTTFGGEDRLGVVFKLSPSGTYTILYRFTGGADGANPYAGLVRDAVGNLYGTTFYGGASNAGVVFKLSPTGTETVLYSFTGGADGAYPYAGLIRDAAGNLYGTTAGGGAFRTWGVVFKLGPSGTETVLHSFAGPTDGGGPTAGLTRDAAGNLYGTTTNGGEGGLGVVFKLRSCGTYTVLHTFTGDGDGDGPFAGLVRDAAGNLYGTTFRGGPSDNGVVFKVSPTGTGYNFSVVYTFTGGADGGLPYAGLVQDAAGNLYGTTASGGATSGACGHFGGCGVVFKLTP
jgi:uncharacterized repeat protein (TIGR03803 family)